MGFNIEPSFELCNTAILPCSPTFCMDLKPKSSRFRPPRCFQCADMARFLKVVMPSAGGRPKLMQLNLKPKSPDVGLEHSDILKVSQLDDSHTISHDNGPSRYPYSRGTISRVSELVTEDLVIGDGAEAVNGKTISVHYSGTLEDGTQFDSSIGRGPFDFPLGAGRVIKGWDLGVAGMKVGGKRKLTIPSELGYGSRGAGGVIPPNATLIFEVDLLDVR